MLMCTICGLWSPCVGGDRLDICDECFTANFSGNLLEAPTAREVLDAYVDSSAQMTPRQVEHILQVEARRHLQARWAIEQEEHAVDAARAERDAEQRARGRAVAQQRRQEESHD